VIDYADPITAFTLGPVQRFVSMDQQLAQFVAGMNHAGDAKAGRDWDIGSVLTSRSGRNLHAYLLSQDENLCQRALGQQDAELLAA
jgi:hypothetical protein